MGSFRLAAGRLHHHKHFNFAESREETVWPSLRHTCRSELTRQGISLPKDRYSYGRRLPGLRFRACTPPLNLPAPGRRQTLYVVFRLRRALCYYYTVATPCFVPPQAGCPTQGLAYPEVTRVICLVPSASFSQAPGYALPVHLCRFRVRSITLVLFPGTTQLPGQSDKAGHPQLFVTSSRPGNVRPVPIDYGFRPRLRGRLTLRGLTLRRNPWTFGDSVSHTVCRYSCQHSHFRYLHHPSRVWLRRPTERSATARWLRHHRTHSFGMWLQPRYIFGAGFLD